jgi:hypothetical protein
VTDLPGSDKLGSDHCHAQWTCSLDEQAIVGDLSGLGLLTWVYQPGPGLVESRVVARSSADAYRQPVRHAARNPRRGARVSDVTRRKCAYVTGRSGGERISGGGSLRRSIACHEAGGTSLKHSSNSPAV